MIRILKDGYVYGEDEFGNFTGNFNEGSYVRIKTYDKNMKCIIKEIIGDMSLKVEDDNFEEFVFCISEVLEIHDLFC